jgi:hypothetical protein
MESLFEIVGTLQSEAVKLDKGTKACRVRCRGHLADLSKQCKVVRAVLLEQMKALPKKERKVKEVKEDLPVLERTDTPAVVSKKKPKKNDVQTL